MVIVTQECRATLLAGGGQLVETPPPTRYPDGQKLFVGEGGILGVQNAAGETIALWAAHQWASAEIGETRTA